MGPKGYAGVGVGSAPLLFALSCQSIRRPFLRRCQRSSLSAGLPLSSGHINCGSLAALRANLCHSLS